MGFEPSSLERFSIRLKRHCEERSDKAIQGAKVGAVTYAGLIAALNADNGLGRGLRVYSGGEDAGAIETALANHDAAQH